MNSKSQSICTHKVKTRLVVANRKAFVNLHWKVFQWNTFKLKLRLAQNEGNHFIFMIFWIMWTTQERLDSFSILGETKRCCLKVYVCCEYVSNSVTGIWVCPWNHRDYLLQNVNSQFESVSTCDTVYYLWKRTSCIYEKQYVRLKQRYQTI